MRRLRHAGPMIIFFAFQKNSFLGSKSKAKPIMCRIFSVALPGSGCYLDIPTVPYAPRGLVAAVTVGFVESLEAGSRK